jgi:hypothetical protein
MVANLGDDDPPVARKAATGRRRRRRRESPLAWWALFAAVALAAWWTRSWRVALLGLLLWCLYEFVLVPTICRIMTRQGFPCREPVRGRLFGCGPAHQSMKNDALWRLVGLRNPFPGKRERAPEPEPDPEEEAETGVLVVSDSVRGRLAENDRMMITLAGVGTLVAVVGMIYGL